jgi:hypothetical protein
MLTLAESTNKPKPEANSAAPAGLASFAFVTGGFTTG